MRLSRSRLDLFDLTLENPQLRLRRCGTEGVDRCAEAGEFGVVLLKAGVGGCDGLLEVLDPLLPISSRTLHPDGDDGFRVHVGRFDRRLGVG